ncbi:MAG: hypothetical protein ORN54_08690, partial [Cyclobacteriaceae bacterium]|nr:hypothetical protein [Cyclobacteriaceae bacterium]
AANLAPEDKEIWLNWSCIYFEQGEPSKAIDVLSQGMVDAPKEPDFLYRMAIYLVESGQFKEAFTYLENALILDFEGHKILFEFFPKLETQKALYRIIDQFRKENS